MDKFVFVNHALNIFEVSSKRDVDVGVGYDMFRTDMSFGRAIDTNTADALPADFDWKTLKTEWDALNLNQQCECFKAWHDFIDANYFALCDAFAVRDDLKFMEVVNNFKKTY